MKPSPRCSVRYGAPRSRGAARRICGGGAAAALPAMLLIPMLVLPGFATGGGPAPAAPLPLDVVVTDVVRERGAFADRLTFTIIVTNNGNAVADVNAVELRDRGGFGAAPDRCLGPVSIHIYETMQLKPCFTVGHAAVPEALAFSDVPMHDDGRDITARQHVLPFAAGQCGDGHAAGNSCQAVQDITGLIRDAEPEPAMCVPSPGAAPAVGSAVYHKYMSDIILTFDMPVTLADGWHENIAIYARAESGAVRLDSLDAGGRNMVPGSSHLVWLSLDFGDAQRLAGVTDMALRIAPGTIVYGDGNALESVVCGTHSKYMGGATAPPGDTLELSTEAGVSECAMFTEYYDAITNPPAPPVLSSSQTLTYGVTTDKADADYPVKYYMDAIDCGGDPIRINEITAGTTGAWRLAGFAEVVLSIGPDEYTLKFDPAADRPVLADLDDVLPIYVGDGHFAISGHMAVKNLLFSLKYDTVPDAVCEQVPHAAYR